MTLRYVLKKYHKIPTRKEEEKIPRKKLIIFTSKTRMSNEVRYVSEDEKCSFPSLSTPSEEGAKRKKI